MLTRLGLLAAAALFIAYPGAAPGEAHADRTPARSDAAIPKGATAVASLSIHQNSHRQRSRRASGPRETNRDAKSSSEPHRSYSRDRRSYGHRNVVRRDRRDRRDRRSYGHRNVVRRDYRDHRDPRFVRRGGVVVRGGVVLGAGVYARSPRRSCCASSVPGYYEPPPPEPIMVSEREPLSTFGFGAFAGGGAIDHEVGTGELGLLARARLSRSFELEAELSRTLTEDDIRLDRNVGAALLYNIMPQGKISPYLLAGAGGSHAEVGGGAAQAGYGYGEVGAGLSFRLTDGFSFVGDLRAGTRTSHRELGTSDALPRDESYGRMRLGALLYF